MKYSQFLMHVLLRDEIMLNLTVVLTFDLLNGDLGVQKLDTSISIFNYGRDWGRQKSNLQLFGYVPLPNFETWIEEINYGQALRLENVRQGTGYDLNPGFGVCSSTRQSSAGYTCIDNSYHRVTDSLVRACLKRCPFGFFSHPSFQVSKCT